jgi:hypothetical protein
MMVSQRKTNGTSSCRHGYAEKKVPQIDYISPQNSKGNFGNPGEQMSRNGKSATYS